MIQNIYTKLLMLFIFTCTSTLMFAQSTHVVKGTVKDKAGEPLPGASVVIEGEIVGTLADIEGDFELKVPSG